MYLRHAHPQRMASVGSDAGRAGSGHEADHGDKFARNSDGRRPGIGAEGRRTANANSSKRLHRAECTLDIKGLGAALEQGNNELAAFRAEEEGGLCIAVGDADHRCQLPKPIGRCNAAAISIRQVRENSHLSPPVQCCTGPGPSTVSAPKINSICAALRPLSRSTTSRNAIPSASAARARVAARA
ncbi:hypothetical protein D9M68_256050 [compost metagenome]